MARGTPDRDGDAPAVMSKDSANVSDLQFLFDEASASLTRPPPSEGAAASPLLYAAGVLQELAEDIPAATESFGEAVRRDSGFVAGWWPLRRLLTAREDWPALLVLLETQAENPALPDSDRADFCVARGRLLEDRLSRPAEAAASYRAALAIQPAHIGALIALLTLAAGLRDHAGVEAAVAGIVKIIAPDADKSVPLLGQLEALARAYHVPRARLAVLDALTDVIGRQAETAPEQAATAAALLREKARLLRDVLFEPRAAFEALRAALRFAPGHPLIAEELMDAGAELGRSDVADSIATLATAASSASSASQEGTAAGTLRETALRQAAMLGAEDRAAEALALIDASGALVADDLRAIALRSVLQAQRADVSRLAAGWTEEGARLGGPAGAHAYVRAGALAEWSLADGARAEQLYQRALTLVPGYGPAANALESCLRAAGRTRELAALWEEELAATESAGESADESGGSSGRTRYLLQSLADLYRDDEELADRQRALSFQRRLLDAGAVAADGAGVAERQALSVLVRTRELELLEETGAARRSERPVPRADGAGAGIQVESTLTALALRAGDPATAAALRIEAARVIVSAAPDEAARTRAEQLLVSARADDRTGLATARLDALLGDPDFRREGRSESRVASVAKELSAAERKPQPELARALRYRLAVYQAAAGKTREALDVLGTLRQGDDGVARALSWELVRDGGDAALALALLREPNATRGLALSTDLAEALEPASPGDALALFAREFGERPSMDAALGWLRCAVAAPGTTPRDLLAALSALAGAARASTAPGDGQVVQALGREVAMLNAALGQSGHPAAQSAAASDDQVATGAPGPPQAAQASGAPQAMEDALLAWTVGARDSDPSQVAAALLRLAEAVRAASGDSAADAVIALLARTVARARLAAGGGARFGEAAWTVAPGAAALALAISDQAGGLDTASWTALPGLRAARAAISHGSLSGVLDLEHALDAELHGRMGEALDAYGRVLAVDPERLEAMEGVRRVAQASGDALGQARALARMGVLLRGAGAAARMFTDGARLFEEAGHADEAIALLWRVLEARPEDDAAADRLMVLLTAELEGRGRAESLDRLLGHKLGRLRPDGAARVPLLLDRALNRVRRLGDRAGAIQDFKRILKIAPEHEDALRELSGLALTDAAPGEAVELLQRYLAVVRDDALAAQARLDLAQAYEALQDIGQAIEVLHQASSVRPTDGQPRQKLSELSLRTGDWRSAVDTLRAWEQMVSEPTRKAQLHLRVGALLRDHGNDPRGAAMSFQLAATLDPMGDGAFALIGLYEILGDVSRRHDVLRGQIIEARRALERDPADVPRLRRLKALLEREAQASAAVVSPARTPPAALPVVQVLALFGELPEAIESLAAPRPLVGSGLDGPGFWTQLASPGATGLLTEVWLHIAEAAARVFPADANRLGLTRQTRLSPATEPRLAWVETSAAALGMTGVGYHAPASSLGRADAEVLAALLPEPTLVFDRAALQAATGTRFRFGRALALLYARATLLDRASPDELRGIFLAARSIARQQAGDEVAGAPASVVRALTKALGRKDRKELSLLAARLDGDPLDVAGWQHAMLRTADRLGLVLAGDVAASLRVIVDFNGQVPVAEQLNENTRALELLRFALSERYLKLRLAAGLDEG